MKARVQINVAFDPDVAVRIQDAAERAKTSISDYVRRAVLAALERDHE